MSLRAGLAKAGQIRAGPVLKTARTPVVLTLDNAKGWPWLDEDTGSMSRDRAMKISTVNRCVEVLSNSMAVLPIYIMDESTKERLTEHRLGRVLWGRANEAMSSFDYNRLMMCNQLLRGNAYAWIFRDKAICRRNGIKQLLWKGDKKLVGKVSQQNLTVHRWFANKACPGDYIYNRLGDIAAKVNVKLDGGSTAAPAAPVSGVPYKVSVSVSDLNIRKGPGTNYNAAGVIKPGKYTIVSEAAGQGASQWGKLKSGAGWVSLDFCKKI